MADAQTANRLFTAIEVGASSNSWGAKLNTNFERVDNILGDTTTVTTTGGNTALTDDEQDVAVIKTSGVLVSNAEIRFDGRRGVWIVYNGNTGAFSTTFIVAGQTGVAVTQGSYALVYSNGTDIVEANFGTELANDTSPQLGADLDANGFDIQFDDNTGIRDDSDNEQLIFQKTASAVNYWEMFNAATGGGVLLVANGSDTDVAARISSKGAGQVQLAIGGTNEVVLTTTALSPSANDGTALGTTSLGWSDLHLATGGVINWANGEITITESDANTLTLAGGAFNFADNVLQRPEIKDYGETVNAIGSIGGGTQDIDLSLGNVVSGTVDTSTTTFTFSNPSPTGKACSFTLFLTNGGSQTVNWPAAVDWGDVGAPTLTTSGTDILTFVTLNAGTKWYGFMSGIGFS